MTGSNDREVQPTSERDVERRAAEVERNKGRSRPSDDDAGINPRRQGGSDAGPDTDHDAGDQGDG